MKFLPTRALRFNEARAAKKFHLLLRVLYAIIIFGADMERNDRCNRLKELCLICGSDE